MNKLFISEIRAFNRFYTQFIGVLDKHILNSEYTLVEVRTMLEIYHHQCITATDLIKLLGIDKGYLSRILKRFEKNGIIAKSTSINDKRTTNIKLTNKGINEFETLNSRSEKEIATMLKKLSKQNCESLIQSMTTIKNLLNNK